MGRPPYPCVLEEGKGMNEPDNEPTNPLDEVEDMD